MRMTYPKIDNTSIWALVEFVEAVKKQPELLDQNACPYPEPMIQIIKDALYKEKAHTSATSSIEDLEKQIADIYEELDEFKNGLDADQEGQVFVSYMRLRGQLLSKMVDIKERVYNIKKMKEFQDTVIKILETVCTAEQRTKVMEMLEK